MVGVRPFWRLLGDVALPHGLHVDKPGHDDVLGHWWDDADIEYVRQFALSP